MIREIQENKIDENKGSNDGDYHDLLKSFKMRQMFQLHKNNDCHYQGIQYIFQIIDLANTYKKDPQNSQTRQKIQQKLEISQQKMIKQKEQNLNQLMRYKFDINKQFMMNKSGGLGMIERKCKFTQKGVLQYENEKSEPKLKEIIGFNNIIERHNAKTNPSKLSWVKQHAKYPYRIVLIDKNKAQKGIYFINTDDAFAVRVYLIQKYKAKIQTQRIKEILSISAHQTQTNISSCFLTKLLQWKKSQTKDNKSQKGSKSKLNEIKLFENSNNQSKLNQSRFDDNRDSHLSQFYFGQKKQFSSQKGIAEDSRSEFGFKKSTNKIKQAQKIHEQKKKFVPYGFVEKLRRYNKASVEEMIEKWRQYVEFLNEQKKPDTVITGETQLFNVLNAVAESELNSKRQKKLRDLQKSVLIFDQLNITLGSPTLIPIKLEVEVSLSKLRGPTQQIVYTTFQSLSSNEQNKGNLVFNLIELKEGKVDERDSRLQLLGGMEKYRLNLRVKQKISEEIVGEKAVFIKELTLFNDKFTIDIVESHNSKRDDHDIEQMNNLVNCQISGRIIDQHQINDENKIKDNNLQSSFELITKMLSFMPTAPLQVRESKNDRDQDSRTHYKRLLSNLPVLDDNAKTQLENILDKQKTVDAINVKSLLCFVPIDGLSSLIPTEEQYSLLDISYKVLERVGSLDSFPSCEMHLNILRHLRSSELFGSRTQLLQAFLSITINWCPQFLEHKELNNPYSSKLSTTIGLSQSLTSIQEKLSLIKTITQHLLNKQCGQLVNKCKQTNIPLVLLVVDYCTNMMTKNLEPKLWIMIMCTLFGNDRVDFVGERVNNLSIEINVILIAVYICRVASDQILASCAMDNVKHILQTAFNQSITMDQNSRFIHNKHLTQSILGFVNTKHQQLFLSQSAQLYLQQIKNNFYTNESLSLQRKTKNRHAQKTAIINSLKNINIQQLLSMNNINNTQTTASNNTPKYLHICFVTLPIISGSLYLRTSSTEFQCTQYQRNPYFVLPDINSPIKLEFIDSKSNQYSFQLHMDVGFAYFTQQVKNIKTSTIIKFQYWAGLMDQNILTNHHSYTNSKELQNSLSSFLTFNNIKEKLLKQPNQSFVFQSIQKQLLTLYQNSNQSGQQILRRIKIAFAQNSKINQYELFLYLTANGHGSLREKIYSLFKYADNLSLEILLSRQSYNLRRIMLCDLLRVMQIPMGNLQYQTLYQGMMNQFSSCQMPKILKAQFICCCGQKLQIKLEKKLYQYLEKRAQKYIYYDIDIQDLLEFLKPIIVNQLNRKADKTILNQGSLKLVISTQGHVKPYEFRVIIKNNNKEFAIDEKYLPQFKYQDQLRAMKPKVLKIKESKQRAQCLDATFSPIKRGSYKEIVNEKTSSTSKIILPTLSPIKKPSQIQGNAQSQSRFKIQTTNNKQKSELLIQLQTKFQHQEQSLQELNLIQYVVNRARRIIPLRYNNKCEGKVMFREFELFEYVNSQLYLKKNNLGLSSVEEMYVNNVRVNDLSFLHNSNYVLHFHTNFNAELMQYCHQIGVQNNLNNIINPKDTQPIKVYFITTNIKSQNYIQSNQLPAKIMVDYGYGIIRWEKCKLVGYFEMKRQKPNKKDRKMYLVMLDEKEKIIQENYIKIQQISNNQVRNLGQITQKNKQKWQSFII